MTSSQRSPTEGMRTAISIACCVISLIFSSCSNPSEYAVLISANAEWRVITALYPHQPRQSSPWGEFFQTTINGQNVLFFHGGWGKVAAAGSTQYVIDRFNPKVLINLGTCGGIEGQSKKFETILADRTVIYDIQEAMGDSKEAIDHYATTLDLSWIRTPYPVTVRRTLLVSGDRDLRRDELTMLQSAYGAVAGDWETGAIAHVAYRNNKQLMILHGISDMVSTKQGEAYGNLELFVQRTDTVMRKLMRDLPVWIDHLEKTAR
ncbi:MAG: hypothetical protein ACKOAR_05440 [Bacteroidota bacterium]